MTYHVTTSGHLIWPDRYKWISESNSKDKEFIPNRLVDCSNALCLCHWKHSDFITASATIYHLVALMISILESHLPGALTANQRVLETIFQTAFSNKCSRMKMFVHISWNIVVAWRWPQWVIVWGFQVYIYIWNKYAFPYHHEIFQLPAEYSACRYNAVNFLQSPYRKHPIARPWVEEWGVFCESNVWFTFCHCLRSAECKIITNLTAL